MLTRVIPPSLREAASTFSITWVNGTPTIPSNRTYLVQDRDLLEELQHYLELDTSRTGRASGDCLCKMCGREYRKHPRHFPFHSEHVDCLGNIWHL